MTIAEYAAHQFGLELRTFAQVIKGIYLWLIMPCILLFAVNSYVKSCFNKAELEQNADIRRLNVSNLLRAITFVILFVVIWAVAFFRGMFYVFTREMVTEEIMADGYIQGEFADFLSESYYMYYVPDILAKGEYIYFHVSDDYTMDSNAFFQILLSEAAHFWNGRERYVTVGSNVAAPLEDAMDKGDEVGVLDSSAKWGAEAIIFILLCIRWRILWAALREKLNTACYAKGWMRHLHSIMLI